MGSAFFFVLRFPPARSRHLSLSLSASERYARRVALFSFCAFLFLSFFFVCRVFICIINDYRGLGARGRGTGVRREREVEVGEGRAHAGAAPLDLSIPASLSSSLARAPSFRPTRALRSTTRMGGQQGRPMREAEEWVEEITHTNGGNHARTKLVHQNHALGKTKKRKEKEAKWKTRKTSVLCF